MPRGRRVAPGDLVYHVLNRGVARLAWFEKDADYEAFERVLAEAMQNFPTRLLSYCLITAYPDCGDSFALFKRKREGYS
jgi:putative transposase